MRVAPPKIVRPRDLREALGTAFMHRTGVRWRAGTSALLDVVYDGSADGATLVDVEAVVDFHTVRVDRTGIAIGAFISPDLVARDAALSTALGGTFQDPHEARFRLNALGARVLVAGPGATRSVDIATVALARLPPHEIPVAVTLHGDRPAVSFGARRIRRRDGAASFDLDVHVALALSRTQRIARAVLAHRIDGGPPVMLPSVAAQLEGNLAGKSTFADAARRAADAFEGDDERTSVLRRTIIPLTLSALNDAYAAAAASRSPS